MANGGPAHSDQYPYIPVWFRVNDYEADVQALVDTGFDGHLIVPRSLSSSLGDPHLAVPWTFADGKPFYIEMYEGLVSIPSVLDPVDALVGCTGNFYILGLAVIDLVRLTLDHGEHILVEP